MVQKNARAEMLFGTPKQADVPAWKAIKDAADKRREEITNKLRATRLARDAAQAEARAAAPTTSRRGGRRKSSSKKKS